MLKTKWARAAFLPAVLALVAAMLAVSVVPIFCPMTMAAAMSKPIHPLAVKSRVMAMTAEEA